MGGIMEKFRIALLGFTGGIITTSFVMGLNNKNIKLSMFFLIVSVLMDMGKKNEKDKLIYYTNCPECGRMADSDEIRMYGKCYNCRW